MSESERAVVLTAEEREAHTCCLKPGRCDEEHYHQRDVERIVAARVAAVVAPIEALASEWDKRAPDHLDHPADYADDIRAALTAAESSGQQAGEARGSA